MRRRLLASLSVTAVAALALAGCGSIDQSEEPDQADTTTVPETMCDAGAPAGEAIESVTVEGDFGEEPQVSFDAPLEVPDEVERQVVVEGSGDPLEDGQSIEFAITAVDAETGDVVGAEGYEPGTNIPAPVSPTSVFGLALGCAEPGTRVAFTVPAQQTEQGAAPAYVYVLDFFEVAPNQADGESQEAPEGFPTVELGEGGAPTVTVPDGFETPETTEIATLIQGDGATVGDGDTVYVQYLGVKASDGSEFDSSWSRGAATSFSTAGVIEGFTKALVGQKVGSQVIAVIPPAEGYGASEGHELQDETLIFVVDILGTMSMPAA